MQWTKGSKAGGEDYSNEKTWSPDVASTLSGRLTQKKTVVRDGEPVVVLKIEDNEGIIWNVWCSRTALRNLVEEYDEQLVLGRIIGLKTEGKIKIEGGKTFYPYELGFADENDIPAVKEEVAESSKEEPF